MVGGIGIPLLQPHGGSIQGCGRALPLRHGQALHGGIRGRGRIAKGAFADLVVWDEAAFKAKATFTDPHQFTDGVRCVMTNGVISYRDGKFTGNRGGRFLER